MRRTIVCGMLTVLLLIGTAPLGRAHEPPGFIHPEVLCFWLGDDAPTNCSQILEDLISEKQDEIRRIAHARYKRSQDTRTASEPEVFRGIGPGVEQWRSLVTQYFGDDADTALCLMTYESGGNPNAKNPRSSARGLMQILGSLWAPHFGVTATQLYEPELNIRLAKAIYDIQGWVAWSPYKRGLCR